MTYQIIRYKFNQPDDREVIDSGLTLEEAQEHCSDEESHGDGWFDGYERED